jgi:hypothetical protein
MMMAELLLPLTALALAAALQPLQVIAMLVLLQTKHPVQNGLAYLGGMTAFRLALAAVFWWLMSGVEDVVEAEGGDFMALTGIVISVLGLLLLVFALRQVFSAQSEDQAAASWLSKLDSVTPLRATLVGVAFLAFDPKDWLIDISAIDLVAAADLSGLQSGLAYLVYIFLAQVLLLIPLIYTLIFPTNAQNTLGRLNVWLHHHERRIEVAVALIFGFLFFFAGLEYLGIF